MTRVALVFRQYGANCLTCVAAVRYGAPDESSSRMGWTVEGKKSVPSL